MTGNMSRRIKAVVLGAGLLAAAVWARADGTQSEATDGRKPYGRGELRKLISVVKTRIPPKIDGVMAEGEWDDAAAITGLTRVEHIAQCGISAGFVEQGMGNMANDQSVFRVAYDDDNLYLAHLSPPPARIKNMSDMIAVMLKKDQSSHDANIEIDDSIDIDIMPVYPGGDKYVIQMNSIGASFECVWYGSRTWEDELLERKLGTPGITLDWDPRMVSKSTLTLDGWTMEVAIPWKELGPVIKLPRPGDVLHMNFGRMWQQVMREDHAWAADDAKSPAGEVCFVGDEGLVVQLEDTGNLPRGQAVFAARIKNRCSTEKKAIAEVSTDSGELKDRKELTLKPGESAPYRFTGTIVDRATTKIALTVTEAGSGKIAHVTTLPVIRPAKPEIFVRRYRSQESMKFETDMAFIGAADLKKTSVQLTVVDKATRKEVFCKTFEGLTSYQPVFELSTQGWVPADYEARFVFNAPGMESSESVVDCEYPPLPEWWNNRCGYNDMDSDIVPYPWTDMKLTNDTVSVWGREYRFGKGLLPDQITTLGYPILRAPMRVVLKTAAGEMMDTAAVESTAQWTKTHRTRVEGARTVEGKQVTLNNAFWAEYDGLVWNTLTLAPSGKVDIVSMELEISLSREFTDVINPSDYSLRATGKFKLEGYAGSFDWPFWMGNGDGGLQLLKGADTVLRVKDSRNVIRVEPGQDGATIRVSIIDTPLGLDAPYEVQFGFIATPVRPVLTRMPALKPRSLTGSGGAGLEYPKGMFGVPAADPGYHAYSCGRFYAKPMLNFSPEALALDVALAVGKDHLFADEFRAVPTERTFEAFGTDYKSKTARDYFVWRHWRYQKKYGGITGYYWDAAFGSMLGMRDVLKRLYQVALMDEPYRLYGAREMNTGFHDSGQMDMSGQGFGIYGVDGENYNSIINANQPTYRGVTDPAKFRAQHMGHNFGLAHMFLGQGRLRDRAGIATAGGPEAVFDHIYGLGLLHDQWVVQGIFGYQDQAYSQLQGRREKDVVDMGLKHWIYQFTPYWRQDIVKLPDENMHASFYTARPSVLVPAATTKWNYKTVDTYFDPRGVLPPFIRYWNVNEAAEALRSFAQRDKIAGMKDRVVMVVYNNTAWEGAMRLKPDWTKIGLGAPASLTASNALHSTGFRAEKTGEKDKAGKDIEQAVFFPRPEEYARIEGEELVFPMTPYNYRMIVLGRTE